MQSFMAEFIRLRKLLNDKTAAGAERELQEALKKLDSANTKFNMSVMFGSIFWAIAVWNLVTALL